MASRTPRTDFLLETGQGVSVAFARGLEEQLRDAMVELISLRRAKRPRKTSLRKAADMELQELERLLGKMTGGPYQCWDRGDGGRVYLMGKVKGRKGSLIGELETLKSESDDFRAIAALLNAAPVLIKLGKERLKHG